MGCGKAFLLFEIKKLLPKIKVVGFDISKYAITKAPKLIKKIFFKDAGTKYNYKKNYFDLVISIGCIHNLELDKLLICLKEIERVGKKNL